MARGTYTPIDRDKHFITAYATDELVDHAYDRTVGAATRRVLPPILTADKAKRGVSDVFRGLKGMQSRGDLDKSHAAVGQEWWHSVNDRKHAVSELSEGFLALAADLANAVAERQHPADAQWIDLDVTPALKEWQAFAKRESASWWTRAATKWEAFESWADKLKQLRQLARARGIDLHSPEPEPLPRTVWERAQNGQEDGPAAWLGIAKTVVFTSITVLGAISLYGVLAGHRTILQSTRPATPSVKSKK